jgi:methylated-DNA-[protein]-cysteine S-methyltransferase
MADMTEIAAAFQSATAGTAGPSDDLVERFLRRATEEDLVDVAYTTYDAPFGPLVLGRTERGLVRVSFQPVAPVLEELARKVSPRVLSAPGRLDAVRRQLDEYFAGRRQHFDVALDWSLVGTAFRRAILDAAARIPYGQVRSYRDVAREAGNEKAVRAAGSALGANPVCIVVPCHRVLRSDGTVGDYGGGPERKAYLLDLERAAI